MTQRNLHGRLPAPYYIYAPNYRETSSGICVLHYLCHALNMSGHEAYVALCAVVNPRLRTPILNDDIVRRHKQTGRTPIVVYPEVVSGNPLAGEVIVRYILNREGFLTGKATQAGREDLIFHYAHDFRGEQADYPMLTLPVIDSELFSPPRSPVQRRKSYLYQHRHPLNAVDFSRLPPDIEVLSLSNPKTLAELAEIFQSAAALYSYEISATCTEAMLCGCPVIYLEGGHITTLPFTEHFGDAGAAMESEPGGLERATATVLEARQRWLDIETSFWQQLETFIALTQTAVADHDSRLRFGPVEGWLEKRVLTPVQIRLIEQSRNDLMDRSSLTIVVVHNDEDVLALRRTLRSFNNLRLDLLPVRLAVLSASANPAELPPDVVWHHREGAQAKQLNELLQKDRNEWFMLLTAGDELLPSGALRLEIELGGAGGCHMVYFDEVHRTGDAQGVALRPDFNFDLLLSSPVSMAGHWLLRRDKVLEIGGFDPAFDSALEFDVILRLIEQNGLGAIAHISEPLVVCKAPALASNANELGTLNRHLRVRNYPNAQIVESPTRHYHIQYGHTFQPLVSIIIPTRDQLPILQRCVESLLEKTAYQNYEILIVDNESQSQSTLDWLSGMEQIGSDKIRVLRFPSPFNFSAINNMAATQANGEYLVLMNNDVAALREDWLDKLLNHAMRPEVGIVGSKLLYPNATLEHAGMILGLRGPASNMLVGESATDAGYMQRRWLDQNLSAVSASCLMIRAALFAEVGGMDEDLFKIDYNDVDLCLKVGQLGYLTVWTPHALLLHEGSISLKSFQVRTPAGRLAEEEAMYKKWLPILAQDPAYNPNMALTGKGFDIESNTALTWQPLTWHPVPRILAYPADAERSSCTRVTDPLAKLAENAMVEGIVRKTTLSVIDTQRYNPDTIIFQHNLQPERFEAIRRAKAFSNAFKVYELDTDLLQLAPSGADLPMLLRQGLGCADRLIVPTEHLADAFSNLCDDVRVVENRLLVSLWGDVHAARRPGTKPRVGILGADAGVIRDVIRLLSTEVQWVFIGPCAADLTAFAHEIHGIGSVHGSPVLLKELGLDLALAPMEDTARNEGRCNLQALQYGACGYPVICSDVKPYAGSLPLTRVNNTTQAWIDTIRAHTHDLTSAARNGAMLRAEVLNSWMLDEVALQTWRDAWLP